MGITTRSQGVRRTATIALERAGHGTLEDVIRRARVNGMSYVRLAQHIHDLTDGLVAPDPTTVRAWFLDFAESEPAA